MKRLILPFLLLWLSGCGKGISGEYESVKADGMLNTTTVIQLKPDGKVTGYMRFADEGTYTNENGDIRIILNKDTSTATFRGDTLFIDGEAFVKKQGLTR